MNFFSMKRLSVEFKSAETSNDFLILLHVNFVNYNGRPITKYVYHHIVLILQNTLAYILVYIEIYI